MTDYIRLLTMIDITKDKITELQRAAYEQLGSPSDEIRRLLAVRTELDFVRQLVRCRAGEERRAHVSA